MTHISHVFFICEKGTWTNWTINWITLCWLHDLFLLIQDTSPKTKEWRIPKMMGLGWKSALLYENMTIFSYQFLRLLGWYTPWCVFVFPLMDAKSVHSLDWLGKLRQPPWVPWSWHISVWNILKKLWRTPTANGVLKRPCWLVGFRGSKKWTKTMGWFCVRWTWGNRTWCRVVPFGTKILGTDFLFVLLFGGGTLTFAN